MDALAGINERILTIQSRIAQLSAPVVAPTQTSMTAGPGGVLGTATGTLPTSDVAFGAALDKAMAANLPPSSSDGIGSGKDRVNEKGIPLELLPYGNGKVPASALSTIAGSNHSLWSPAARSFEAMRDAAAREGVTIGITDSYRTYESQVDLVARKGLYSQGGLAAKPGTSEHGWGIAVDLKLDSTAQAWMRENAGAYGFLEDVPREPWHWAYNPTH